MYVIYNVDDIINYDVMLYSNIDTLQENKTISHVYKCLLLSISLLDSTFGVSLRTALIPYD